MSKSDNGTSPRLSDNDWNSLFPGEDYKIGSTIFKLVPLSLKDIANITEKLSRMANVFSTVQLTLTLEDVDSRNIESITGIVQIITEEAPEILSILSGLHKDDIQKLPLTVAVDLFNKCLDINIESQESLVKNFKSLGEKFNKFLGQEQTEPAVVKNQTRARISES